MQKTKTGNEAKKAKKVDNVKRATEAKTAKK